MIQLNEQARQHPLFPPLDYVVRTTYQHGESLRELKQEVLAVKTEVIAVSEALKELKYLMEKVSNEAFDLEKSGFKVLCM